MSDDPQVIDEIGFRIEDTEDTDPIVNNDETFYTFGRYHYSFGNFPEIVTEDVALYKGSSFEPYALIAAGTKVMIQLGFQALHAIPFFMIFGRVESGSGLEDGGVTDLGGDTYLLVPVTDGDTATYTVRWHSISLAGNTSLMYSVTGCKFFSLTFSLDLMAVRSPLTISLGGMGKFTQDIQANTDDYSLVSPDSLDTPFYADSTLVYEFNSVDLADYLLFIAGTIERVNWPDGSKSHHEPQEIYTTDIACLITVKIRRTDETSMFEAYLAQAGAKGQSDNVLNQSLFSVSNADGKTIGFVWGSCLIKSCKINDANLKKGEHPYYEITYRVQNTQVAIYDGITTETFYGIGT